MHEVLDTLQDTIWSDVLMREKFTRLGAAQFYRDLAAVWEMIDMYIPDGSSSSLGMPRLREACILLNLPERSSRRASEGLASSVAGSDDGRMTLEEATEKVFADNTMAKEVLDRLGFKNISPQEARQVLDRRQV